MIEIKNIIDEILKTVDECGLYLSSELDSDTIAKIRFLLPKDKEIISFILKDETNHYRFVVRKYLKYKKELDFKAQTRKASLAYNKGNYEEALKLNLTTLENINKPKAYPYLFGSIGITYLHLHDTVHAIPYLIVATLISKEKNKKVDYTQLIEKLTKKNNEPLDEIEKPEVNFSLNEFKDDITDAYGIQNIKEIIREINKGMTILDTCNYFNLTYNEYLKVLLYLAKEYYILGLIENGNKLLEIVEKSKNKTKEINNIKDEIRKNKMFFTHRETLHKTLINVITH